MKESAIVTRIRKNFIGVIHKNHGSAYGTAGLPDLEGCSQYGESFILEVKVGSLGRSGQINLKSPLTKIQRFWLERYRDCNAKTFVAVYLENKKQIIFFDSDFSQPKFHYKNRLQKRECLLKFFKTAFLEKETLGGKDL